MAASVPAKPVRDPPNNDPVTIMSNLAFLSMPGGSEWLIILFIVLLIFGGRKLPELARSFGSSINEFKKGMKDGHDSVEGPAKTKENTNGS